VPLSHTIGGFDMASRAGAAAGQPQRAAFTHARCRHSGFSVVMFRNVKFTS